MTKEQIINLLNDEIGRLREIDNYLTDQIWPGLMEAKRLIEKNWGEK
ncbi:hypothetical protein [Siminovitchia fordii]|uniref:Uncharacterized protein n=1 Tax=Siminovitchia fordii TaxID=254759 RepID=A0ABQ4KA12_9BACI|nr:hypothetical protein [Siminovitchia fordii]GIN22564.1 hypothetical protein J1TS3_36980 [Siminovitchia fordii]